MRRRTLRIVLFLILGCVTTVAVAWGCIVSAELSYEFEFQRPTEYELDVFNVGSRPAAIHDIQVIRGTSVGVAAVRFHDDSGLQSAVMVAKGVGFSSGVWWYGEAYRAGWPEVALGAESWRRGPDWSEVEPKQGDFNGRRGLYWGFLAPKLVNRVAPGERVLVPLRPIWPGFVINTMLYGVIWFGIFLGFSSARRALRKKRGRCPKCAYDLRGKFDAGCSECGWNRPEIEA